MMRNAKVYQLYDEKRVMALAFVDRTTYLSQLENSRKM